MNLLRVYNSILYLASDTMTGRTSAKTSAFKKETRLNLERPAMSNHLTSVVTRFNQESGVMK